MERRRRGGREERGGRRGRGESGDGGGWIERGGEGKEWREGREESREREREREKQYDLCMCTFKAHRSLFDLRYTSTHITKPEGALTEMMWLHLMMSTTTMACPL